MASPAAVVDLTEDDDPAAERSGEGRGNGLGKGHRRKPPRWINNKRKPTKVVYLRKSNLKVSAEARREATGQALQPHGLGSHPR